jgi:hypothetical protein
MKVVFEIDRLSVFHRHAQISDKVRIILIIIIIIIIICGAVLSP